MFLFSRSAATRSATLAAASSLAIAVFGAQPAGAEPAATAGQAAPQTDAAGTVARTLLTKVEDKIAASKSLILKSTSIASGAKLPKVSPIVVTATLERPALLQIGISIDGKDVGRIVTGPDGGYVYDTAGNRYIKVAKGSTPKDTVRKAFGAAESILPDGVLLGMYVPVSFLMEAHPLQMLGDKGVDRKTSDDTVNGAAVTHVAQTITQGASITKLDVYIDKKNELPVEVAFSGSSNGQAGASLKADFASFELGDTQPAATFDATPPATATIYTPPAPPAAAAPEGPAAK